MQARTGESEPSLAEIITARGRLLQRNIKGFHGKQILFNDDPAVIAAAALRAAVGAALHILAAGRPLLIRKYRVHLLLAGLQVGVHGRQKHDVFAEGNSFSSFERRG